ncbi:hypothetical protein ACFY2R_00545 [Micromonospora olivasterospora]|uniref:Uncharacterized protein n=1 Tax=Micromonospora olivasterospora TaxID=1880 RepID=A0A562I9C5_MICOL|nr:hypothetical protein [Micromonospora olivasterospora]TWH67617.1 hypothetical protein JD77_02597 [Micromonospora olivasterospora]
MTVPVPVPVRPPRPTSVTVAGWLQVVTVAVLLGLAGMVAFEAVWFDGQIDEVTRLVPDADPAEVRDERTGNVVGALVLGVPALLLAGWLAGTALPLLRGRNTARILVYVSSGAQLLLCLAQACSGALVIPFVLALGFEEGMDAEPAPFPDDVPWQESRFLETLYDRQQAHDDVIFPVGGIGVLTVFLLTATVVLLLSLPAANRYFRPRAEQWPVGPVPYAGWPGPHPMVAPYPMMAPYPMGPAVPQPGAWVPAGCPVPPGYLICPDPAVHVACAPAPAEPPGTDRPETLGS